MHSRWRGGMWRWPREFSLVDALLSKARFLGVNDRTFKSTHSTLICSSYHYRVHMPNVSITALNVKIRLKFVKKRQGSFVFSRYHSRHPNSKPKLGLAPAFVCHSTSASLAIT